MPNRTQRVFYGLCISLFSFWLTLRVLEPLWPKARARPIGLPMSWLFLTVCAFCVCMPSLARSIRNERWLKVAILVGVSLGPICLGYLGLQLQLNIIGFELAE